MTFIFVKTAQNKFLTVSVYVQRGVTVVIFVCVFVCVCVRAFVCMHVCVRATTCILIPKYRYIRIHCDTDKTF